MAHTSLMNMIIDESDSNDELKILIATTIVDHLKNDRRSILHHGSVIGYAVIYRDLVQDHERLYRDYFSDTPIYPPNLFNQYNSSSSNRSQVSLMNHWSMIQAATNKFSGCFSQFERLNRSGTTENDKIRDAKTLYKELFKTSFPFEQCWNELRYQPKWWKEYEMKKEKSKKATTPVTSSPSTPNVVNLGHDDGSNNNFVDLERPLGSKTEKDRLKKRKSRVNGNNSLEEGSPIMVLLKEMKEERTKMNDKKIELYERSYLQEQERLAQEKEKLRIKQLKEEERIMSMSTTGMPSLQEEYIRCRQIEILEQRK